MAKFEKVGHATKIVAVSVRSFYLLISVSEVEVWKSKGHAKVPRNEC